MPTFNKSFDPTGLADGFTPGGETPEREPESDELLGNLQTMFRQARTVKYGQERQWEWNLGYLRGDFLVYQDVVNGTLTRVPVTGKNRRLYSRNNRLRPIARSLVGKLSRSIPSFAATPPTMEQDEVYGARVADAAIKYFQERQDIQSKYVEMQKHLTWAGNSCIQALWDECAGRKLAHCTECETTYEQPGLVGSPCPRCEAVALDALAIEADRIANESMAVDEGLISPDEMQPPTPPPVVPNLILVYEGDVVAKVHDPRTVYIDPLAIWPADARYIFIRTIQPVTTLRARFPEKADIIMPGMGNVDSSMFPNMAPQMSNSVNGAYQIYNDATTFYEYHEAPSFSHSKGRIIYFTNNSVIAEKEGNYDLFNRLPFFFSWWEKDAGYFWAEPFITQAWSRQKELNELETALRETTEILARPKVITYANSGLPGDELTAQTAQVVKVKMPGYEPRYMDPPQLPEYLFERKQAFVNDMMAQASVSAADDGSADANGRVMAIIEAESNQQIGPMFKTNASEWKAFYLAVLKLMQACYSQEKKFMVAGAEGLAVYSFNDLRFDEGWDLVLEMEDGLSQNPAIRLQQVSGMANLPVFIDQKTGTFNVAAFADMARLKIPGISVDLNGPEYAAATAMIKGIETDQPNVTPQMYDDPEIFAKVLLQWLRTHGRRNLDPILTSKIQALWMYYTQLLVGQPSAPPMGVFGQEQASPAGSTQSAPGGTPNNPGQIGTMAMSASPGQPTEGDNPVLKDASGTLQAADGAAETAARVQENQES